MVHQVIAAWTSGNKKIRLSISHKDLHIVEHGDGTFHTVTASNQYMLEKYPIDLGSKKSKRIW